MSARFTGAGITIAAVALLIAVVPSPLPRKSDPLTGMPFVRLPSGTFTMGTPPGEPQREAQEIEHRVRIPQPFYLAIHEVTQAEWTAVMHANPSHFPACGPNCPVEEISFHDVEAFLRRLNATSPWPGFRLPTEAEWEYACRAGGREAYGAAATLTPRDANIDGSHGSTMPVGSFAPNAWGLFDMSGNVWEWTSDNYAPYAGATPPDSPTWDPAKKVIRGGSWLFGADSARCGLRYTHRPQDKGPSLGVRLAHDAG